MGKRGAVAALALREGGEKFSDAPAEINGQNEDRAELDDDGVHLPVAAGEINMKERFAEPEVRRGAYGKKFRDAFHNAEQDGQQIIVQIVSPGFLALLSGAGASLSGPGFSGLGASKILRIS